MKKILIAALLLLVFSAAGVFGQGAILKSRLLGLDNYVPLFIGTARQLAADGNRTRVESQYMRALNKDKRTNKNNDMYIIAILADRETIVDTYLEFALASYYSPEIMPIRPTEADAILPASDPRLSGLKLGAAVYKELVELRFLGDTAAIGRYEGMLKFIQDKNGISRTEIENYYRDGIRGLIAEIVNEEFNKISFLARQNPSSYGCVLTRNQQNGHYTLSYEGYFNNSNVMQTKTLSASSLEALLVSLSRSGDFSQAAINTVRAQAALIPAVAYPVSTLNDVVSVVSNFYLSPNKDTFHALGVKYRTFILTDGDKGKITGEAYLSAIYALNTALGDKVPGY